MPLICVTAFTPMEAGRASATAVGAAVVRALHQTIDGEPRIIDDPIAARLVGEELERYQRVTRLFPFSSRLRANFVMRNRYAEDCLAQAVADGVRQYVLLGAGLDTFAYRQPAWASPIRIFEVDYPATQEWKRTRLAAAAISVPVNLSFVALDFERIALADGLVRAGFDCTLPAFFSLLGVTQYLSEEALGLTLKFVLSLPRRSEIVFSFVLASSALSLAERAAAALFAAIAAMRGERWLSRFVPAELAARLSAMGFSKVVHFSADDAKERYFRGRRDRLAPANVEQMMSATF